MESQPQNPEFRINPENFHPLDDAIRNNPPPSIENGRGIKIKFTIRVRMRFLFLI